MPTFYEYLIEQKRRDDPVGDLAADAVNDPNWPRAINDYKLCDRHLTHMNACAGAHRALTQAWKEWKRL